MTHLLQHAYHIIMSRVNYQEEWPLPTAAPEPLPPCIYCHENWHVARECPHPLRNTAEIFGYVPQRARRMRPRQPVPMSIQCRRCDQFGHYATNCPLNDTYEPPTLSGSLLTDVTTCVLL